MLDDGLLFIAFIALIPRGQLREGPARDEVGEPIIAVPSWLVGRDLAVVRVFCRLSDHSLRRSCL